MLLESESQLKTRMEEAMDVLGIGPGNGGGAAQVPPSAQASSSQWWNRSQVASAHPGPAPEVQATPLNRDALLAAPPAVQKQIIGEKLYATIHRHCPAKAGKITGMMLEMDNSELLMLLESESQLKTRMEEAMDVLGIGPGSGGGAAQVPPSAQASSSQQWNRPQVAFVHPPGPAPEVQATPLNREALLAAPPAVQ